MTSAQRTCGLVDAVDDALIGRPYEVNLVVLVERLHMPLDVEHAEHLG